MFVCEKYTMDHINNRLHYGEKPNIDQTVSIQGCNLLLCIIFQSGLWVCRYHLISTACIAFKLAFMYILSTLRCSWIFGGKILLQCSFIISWQFSCFLFRMQLGKLATVLLCESRAQSVRKVGESSFKSFEEAGGYKGCRGVGMGLEEREKKWVLDLITFIIISCIMWKNAVVAQFTLKKPLSFLKPRIFICSCGYDAQHPLIILAPPKSWS